MSYPHINQILHNTDYSLSIFTRQEIERLENRITSKTDKGKTTYAALCLVRNKSIKLTPEEVVRHRLYRMS